jgi:hypothetical protein
MRAQREFSELIEKPVKLLEPLLTLVMLLDPFALELLDLLRRRATRLSLRYGGETTW